MAEQERWIVDRFEGEYAVIERAGGETFNIPRYLLPSALKEGDVVGVMGSEDLERATWFFERDPEETARLKEELRRQVNELKGQDPGGDIEL